MGKGLSVVFPIERSYPTQISSAIQQEMEDSAKTDAALAAAVAMAATSAAAS